MKTRKLRRKRCTIIFLINAFFILIIFISSYHHTHRLRRLKEQRINRTLLNNKGQQQLGLVSSESLSQHPQKSKHEAIILLWTNYFGGDLREDPSWNWIKSAYPKCFDKCRLVFDKSLLEESDAVVFHSRDMRKNEMPTMHGYNQIWVYQQQESPSNTGEDLTEYENVFNWTMTYRRDSDIYNPYFVTIPKNPSEITSEVISDLHEYPDYFQRKTKLVAWIVSNCYTKGKREDYVDQLEASIPIDIYGSCGDFSCERSGNGCLPEIAEKYKFFLSFENSLCVDYITEKLSNALQYNLVPIVYGGGNYSAVAPQGSYIDVNDFATPSALAKYLLLLDKNPKLYLNYFKWKSKYKVVVGNGWCSLCRKIKKQKEKPEFKVYEDLSKWWHYGSDKTNKDSQNTKKSLPPMCHEEEPGFLEKWNLLNVMDGFKNARRWFRRKVLQNK